MSFWMVLLGRLSSGSIRLVLLVLGPIATIVFYGYIISRYRNTDKSYQFEEITRAELQDVQGSDTYLESVGRMQEEYVKGHEYSKELRNRLRMWQGVRALSTKRPRGPVSCPPGN